MVVDSAVLNHYGFNPKKDLLALNFKVAARIDRNEPVTAPGIPPNFPNPNLSSPKIASNPALSPDF